jgi:peroxiredoxin
MNAGLVLTALSATTAIGNLASYYPKMMSNRASLRPRREQLLMILSLLLAGAGFFLHPGILGYSLGALAVVPAALFLLGTFTSGLPNQRPTVAVDDLALDFSALDADGREFRLSDLHGSPVLLKFYRGYWCPYCVAELTELNGFASDFAALGVRLVAISSDRVDELRLFKRKHDWDITLVADPTLAVHRLYNLQQRNFTPRRGLFRDLAIPTTILIDRDGRILWLEQAIDFRVRPQASTVLAKAKALLIPMNHAPPPTPVTFARHESRSHR